MNRFVYKLFNAMLVVVILFGLSTASVSTARKAIRLKSNNNSVDMEVITQRVVETTTEITTIPETTTQTETTTEKATETTTKKAVETIKPETTVSESTTAKPQETTETTTMADTSGNGYYTENDVIMLCKVTWGEAGSLSKLQQAGVVWCVLNRVDSSIYPNDISAVITQKSQFYGYKAYHPINPKTESVVRDVLSRWVREKQGETNVGRVLPEGYMAFYGNGRENIFSKLNDKTPWDWSLPNPYA